MNWLDIDTENFDKIIAFPSEGYLIDEQCLSKLFPNEDKNLLNSFLLAISESQYETEYAIREKDLKKTFESFKKFYSKGKKNVYYSEEN